MTCNQPNQPGIHLDCCPACNHNDQTDAGYGTAPGAAARAVCASYHLEHVHEGETWEQRHRHMFYGPHRHVATDIHDGRMPRLARDGTMLDNRIGAIQTFTPQGEDEGRWL